MSIIFVIFYPILSNYCLIKMPTRQFYKTPIFPILFTHSSTQLKEIFTRLKLSWWRTRLNHRSIISPRCVLSFWIRSILLNLLSFSRNSFNFKFSFMGDSIKVFICSEWSCKVPPPLPTFIYNKIHAHICTKWSCKVEEMTRLMSPF